MIRVLCYIQSTNIGEVDPEREELKDVETCRVCLKGFDWPLKHNTVCQACGKVSTFYSYAETVV